MTTPAWLTVTRGESPLFVSLPHTGTDLPGDVAVGLRSAWLARKDTDWWVDRLYAFATDLGATVVRTSISRTAIDVNRDPSGTSLYPGQTTTALCPIETFDGEPLYESGREPDDPEIGRRRETYFHPYHAAIEREIARLRAAHPRIVVYDCHSIRSVVPRLFEGELPQFNIGTDGGRTCAPELTDAVERCCDASGLTRVTNGRFRGGYITRHYGRPDGGIHAIQMELACRGYMREPVGPVDESTWPVPWSDDDATAMRSTLRDVLGACLDFARQGTGARHGASRH